MDTESDCVTKQIALIQIHTIPCQLPSMILFIQLNHLPPRDSLLFQQICLMFQLIFQRGNELFSWGPPIKELERASAYFLFSVPLACTCINLQHHFKIWIERRLPPCEVCLPNINHTYNVNPSPVCICGAIPYVNTNETWSLQNAVLYASGLSLDKSYTEAQWSVMLDPKFSTMPSNLLHEMIRYAVYDCLVVTYFRRPVDESWSLSELHQATIETLFTSTTKSLTLSTTKSLTLSINKNVTSNSFKLIDSDLESVSDDDIIWYTSSRPPIIKQTLQLEESNVFIHMSNTDIRSTSTALFDLKSALPSSVKLNSHSRRSLQSRKRRNKKRNYTHRLSRYRYCVIRVVYYRFKPFLIKKMLRDMNIRFIHVKKDKNRLFIGVKNSALRDQCHDRLPLDFFSREQFYRDRKH